MQEFQKTFVTSVMKNLEQKFAGMDSVEDLKKNMGKVMKEGAAAAADIGVSMAKYPAKKALQERENLSKLSIADKIKIQKSKSVPNKNSEEYLTYILKQGKPLKDQGIKPEDMF